MRTLALLILVLDLIEGGARTLASHTDPIYETPA
jgi:hypothetical protein